VGIPLPLDLERFVDKFGSWHQKLQLIKRAAAQGAGEEFIAYTGGIDLNPNRMDTPGHQVNGPYHDVHARVTGPAVADLFRTWHERWEFHRDDPDHPVAGMTPDPVFDPPDPDTIPEQPARHLVQVGRTLPRGNPVDNPRMLPFAEQGDTSTYETMLRALKAAREYIYVEDQYFTPNDSVPPGSADTYFDALMGAAADCKRLIVLIPAESDQIFGDLRRRQQFALLRTVWDNRMLIGTPMRRHVLADPGRIASEGRCQLMQPIGMPGPSGLDTLVLGPAARVPDGFPYWISIEGELMVTAGLPYPTTVHDLPCKAVDVLRGPAGSDPRWGATPRPHGQFASATMAQLKSIYVHAKVTMVDDVYVTIGTSNINRKGFFFDGEVNVFAIPEQLRASADNPARALRSALWAEHLGIAPGMGPALLGDPIAAFDLFRRPRLIGNRFIPYQAMDLKPYLGVPIGDGMVINLLAATAMGWAASHIPLVWNDVVDPTSFADPLPLAGPVSGQP
jgi:phosphatidylserine/phosphatidylglycerophosphate/cardiolipin synthase-like enzyme